MTTNALPRKILFWSAGAIALAVLAWQAMRDPVQMASVVPVSRGPLEQSFLEEGKTRLKQRYVITAPLAGVPYPASAMRTMRARSIAALGPELTLRTIGIRCSTLRNWASAWCCHASLSAPNHVSLLRFTNTSTPPITPAMIAKMR